MPTDLAQGLVFWRRDPGGNVLGGNDAYLTPRAVMAMGELERAGGRYGARQIVDAEFLNRATSKQILPNTERVNHNTLIARGYGYLWWLLEIGGFQTIAALGHGGQMLLVLPELDAVVVITSRWPGPSDSEHYQHLARLLESEVIPWLRSRGAMSSEE